MREEQEGASDGEDWVQGPLQGGLAPPPSPPTPRSGASSPLAPVATAKGLLISLILARAFV